MNKIIFSSALGLCSLLTNAATQADDWPYGFPLYSTPLETRSSGHIFEFKYAKFEVPDFIKRTLATGGPWFRNIKTSEELQKLYTESWAQLNNQPPHPQLPAIDFTKYQLVMGGIGIICGAAAELGITDVTYHTFNDIRVFVANNLTCTHINPFMQNTALGLLIRQSKAPITTRLATGTFKYD